MSRPLKRVFELYVFALTFLLASRPLSDGDFWFHLKTGEYIFNTGLVPKQEIFSFTSFGSPWIAHGWLSGLIFYVAYSKTGFYPLMAMFALLTVLSFWIVFKRSKGHLLVRAGGTLIGAWAVMPSLGVRPRVFTLLLTSIFLYLLADYVKKEKARTIWWSVPFMALWVNLHGGFPVGLLLIVLTFVGILLDGWVETREWHEIWPRLRTLSLVLIGCMAAVALNPYGLKMYALPLEVMRTPIYQAIVIDFLSPNFHQPEKLAFAILLLATMGALALSPKRVKLSELLLVLATLYSSLQTQRNIMIFVLVAVPLLAEHFQAWLDLTPLAKYFKESDTPAATRGSVILSLILLLPLVFFGVQLKRLVYVPPRQETSKVPIKAVEYLKEHQITGNTITVPYIWGGYLIWAMPSNPVYIDGRNAYPQEFVQEYVEMTEGYRDWRGPLDQHGVKNAIVQKSSVMERQLAQATDWQRVYEDELAVVFVRRTPASFFP